MRTSGPTLFSDKTFTFNSFPQGILEAVESEVRDERHKNFGCHVLVIMSHGSKDNYIYGTDGRKVSLIDIYDLLTPLNFPGMVGKPKVVIVQACSGGETFVNFSC